MYSVVTLCFILASFCRVESFLLIHNAPRKVTKVLTVDNGDSWGDWSTPHFCAEGTYAVGYDMKIEPYQGSSDDTEMNGVLLYCESLDGAKYGGEVTAGEGPWGNWVGLTKCDNQNGLHHFLTSFALQVEPSQGGTTDDTGANYIKFHCRDFESTTQQYELARPPGKGDFGAYGDWSGLCDTNSAICGISTKIEAPQGSSDDTTLNDVKMYCCSE